MSGEAHHRPEETDFAEARGAGLAAILMFLQIALIGYLLYALYYLATGENALSSLRPFRAGWQYFLPAAFAASSYFPTDPLTKAVGKTAAIVGWIAWTAFACLAWIAISRSGVPNTIAPSITAGTLLECMAGALWGSALGASVVRLTGAQLFKLRTASQHASLDSAGLVAVGTTCIIGMIAGMVTWSWQNGQTISWGEYAMAGGSVAGMAGLSAIMGTKSAVKRLWTGLTLCLMALLAVFLVPAGGPFQWFIVMGAASTAALLNAGKRVVKESCENVDAVDLDIS